jgi:streptomycin 3"-adenylyltransferase
MMPVILGEIKKEFSAIIKDNLVGIYLHGSLAMGGFNPESSDIDFLVVVREKLPLKIKKQLIAWTLKSARHSPENRLEYSILTLDQVKNFHYPTPFELHYSNDWQEKYRRSDFDWAKQNLDPDLAAHFVITKKRGLVLTGKPINEIFPLIPEKYYLDSIIKDFRWSEDKIMKGPDSGGCPVPVYGVLNFCRVLAYLQDKLITSKVEGGQWGLVNLPEKYHKIIREALKEYDKVGSAQPVDATLLKQFTQFVANGL